jgi:flagellar biosynthesis GTPase FlhF
MEQSLPVSYITTGQNVPEDIEQAERAKLLKLIVS